MCADFDAQQPIRTTAAESTVSVANASQVTINPAEDFAQGSTTSGQSGVLDQGATTTSAPTYSDGTTNPLSLDTSGNLRVLLGAGSTTAVTGNVTVVQPTGSNLHVDVDNFPADSDAYAQGSTTSGQLGPLIQGAVTTAAPSYTTGQTDPLSLTTAGSLRTDIEQVGGSAITLGQKTSANSFPVVFASDQSAIPVSITFGSGAILTYFTDSAVASGATVTHSLAGPITLDHIHASGSGELKMNVATGTTGSETDKWVGFTSASYQNCEFDMEQGLTIATGQSVKVTLKNRDTNAQDLYLTFETH